MKKLLALCLIILSFLTLLNNPVLAQLTFKTDQTSEHSNVTLLSSAARTDTAYSSYVTIPEDVYSGILYTNCTTASASDSLKVEVYQSADASAWKLTHTLTTITAVTLNRTLLEGIGKYLKLRYYVQGASSSFTFSSRLVPK